MISYNISFEYDFSNIENYIDNADVKILNIDLDGFAGEFNNKKGIKEFENWFNEGAKDKIKIIDIIFDGDEETGCLKVILENELKNEQEFANEIVNYIFEGECPKAMVNFEGYSWVDDFDYYRGEHTEKRKHFDFDKNFTIDSYVNVTINKN